MGTAFVSMYRGSRGQLPGPWHSVLNGVRTRPPNSLAVEGRHDRIDLSTNGHSGPASVGVRGHQPRSAKGIQDGVVNSAVGRADTVVVVGRRGVGVGVAKVNDTWSFGWEGGHFIRASCVRVVESKDAWKHLGVISTTSANKQTKANEPA